MTSFQVFEKGQRPWPDEVSWLSRPDTEDKLQEELSAKISSFTVDQLSQLADLVGMTLEARD